LAAVGTSWVGRRWQRRLLVFEYEGSVRRFGILLKLVDENDGNPFVEKRSLFTQSEFASAGFLVKNASDANGREKDDFENDGGQKLDEEWVV